MRHSVTTLPHHKAAITRLGISPLITPRNELILSQFIATNPEWAGEGWRKGSVKACCSCTLTGDQAMGGASVFQSCSLQNPEPMVMFPLPESEPESAGPLCTGLERTTGSEGPTPQFLNSMLSSLRNYAPANLLCVWSCIGLCPTAEYLFHIKVIVFL